MSVHTTIPELRKEIARLQKEKEEWQYLLTLKEEEMQEWKAQPDSVPALYSKLQERLYDFEHLQQVIEKLRRELNSSGNREANMEDELIRQLSVETLYDELKEKHRSVQAAILTIQNDLNEAMDLYRTLASQEQLIAEWKSKWELANLDNQFLREQLDKKNVSAKNKI
jgi:chromosome segregation ATPase